MEKILRDIRLDKGYTQEEVAKGIGISRRQYIKYEKGQIKLNYKILDKLSNFYKINRYDLLKLLIN